jgi:hypothetical protein
MTIAQQIGQRHESVENAMRLGQFGQLVKCLMLGGAGQFGNAEVAAKSRNVWPEVRKIIESGSWDSKAAQSSLTLSGGLSDYSLLANSFLDSLSSATIFDQLLPSMTKVPVVSATIGSIAIGASGFSVSESSIKPLGRLTFATQQSITPQKAHCLVAVSKELARSMDPAALNFVIRQLRLAVSVQTDAAFISTITSGVSTITSSGTNAQAIKNDISNMLQAMTTGSDSKLFFVTTPLVAKMLTTILSDQSPTFAAVTPLGGTLAGLPLLVSDGVTTGQLLLIDAGGLAGNIGELFLQTVEDAFVQQDTAPDSPPTASTIMQSFYSLNQVGIRCERFFVAAKLRSDAVQIIQTTNSYTGGSP